MWPRACWRLFLGNSKGLCLEHGGLVNYKVKLFCFGSNYRSARTLFQYSHSHRHRDTDHRLWLGYLWLVYAQKPGLLTGWVKDSHFFPLPSSTKTGFLTHPLRVTEYSAVLSVIRHFFSRLNIGAALNYTREGRQSLGSHHHRRCGVGVVFLGRLIS